MIVIESDRPREYLMELGHSEFALEQIVAENGERSSDLGRKRIKRSGNARQHRR